ncbi:MAG: phosphoenolpyruvate kinase [Cytophagales bacterium]|nr:phosphoenolpyruvate kinase [Cytophagales bacterium]
MSQSIPSNKKESILSDLGKANKAFQEIYPGDKPDRQPVHTVYGGADLFKSDSAQKMGQVAMKALKTYTPDSATFAKVMGFSMSEELASTVYEKVCKKLETEPVEDFRIDFEDGFGNRSWEEEDTTAEQAAIEVAKGMEAGTLPPFIGIRIKPFTEDLKERGSRTLDIFVSTLAEATGGKLPDNFVVMLPKVTIPEQVAALVQLFELLESNTELATGSLKCEMMVETTQSMIDAHGQNPLRKYVLASMGRMIATAFGTYDYTASNNITARYQDMGHGVCDFAHYMMKVSLGSTGIWLSDGATNVMPIGPNRGENFSQEQFAENSDVMHRTWKQAFDHTRHSLWKGLYQGWDLHPAQFPSRYAAVYSFFLESYDDALHRLKTFVERAARATLTGEVFDDAATGQGLLNYFLTGLNCGALSEEQVLATGLTIEEIQTRSFLKILEGRRG